MNREELYRELMSLAGEGEIVYIERRGERYDCRRGIIALETLSSDSASLPDAWIFYSGAYPPPDAGLERWRAFFEDLIAEMESMAGGADRCRWPLDAPWPLRH